MNSSTAKCANIRKLFVRKALEKVAMVTSARNDAQLVWE